MTEVLPAATVVVVREGRDAPELLLLRRNSKLAFHGGAWVFPGGRVDPHEGEGEPAARRAAAREAREEAGLELDAASLVQISHWTTPEGQPRRFATWFYITQLGGRLGRPTRSEPQANEVHELVRDEVRIDGGEIHEHRWFTAEDALAAQRAKAIELPPPTFVTLSILREHRTAADAIAAAAARDPFVYLPRFMKLAGGFGSLYPGDAGWESRDPELPGARHRLLMLEDGWRYLRDA